MPGEKNPVKGQLSVMAACSPFAEVLATASKQLLSEIPGFSETMRVQLAFLACAGVPRECPVTRLS